MGPTQSMMNRPPILPHPYQRPMMPRAGYQDPNYYRPPMRDPRGFPMGMAPVPPYGYHPHMRPPGYPDPYGYMGPRPFMPAPHPMSMHHNIVEAPPPG